ncbi:hypothetical protein DL89DRAFT_112522 [Linderina pennispora]|uniref:Uncharacterized protein n=1 Tax=Linderina pennispora TaxID=61395 RepID=A0A1Y1WFS0_9FUNG|nr:uncharacterized protein DL89DRAFT_112522 [Linderina pennispora]ORX72363.1 hypothetical protein DL89DRAFT_112522 [Linderina pennispora]
MTAISLPHTPSGAKCKRTSPSIYGTDKRYDQPSATSKSIRRNMSIDTSGTQEEWERQAEKLVIERLRGMSDAAHNMIIPENSMNSSLADELVIFTAELLGRYIHSDDMLHDAYTRKDKDLYYTLMNLAISPIEWLSSSNTSALKSYIYYLKATITWFVGVVPNPHDFRNPWIKTLRPQWPSILFQAAGITT